MKKPTNTGTLRASSPIAFPDLMLCLRGINFPIMQEKIII
jgi:hypothetical protein